MSSLRSILAAVAATGAVVAASAAPAGATVTTFDFHRITNTNSILTIYQQELLDGRILNQASYRAGSGLNKNECD